MCCAAKPLRRWFQVGPVQHYRAAHADQNKLNAIGSRSLWPIAMATVHGSDLTLLKPAFITKLHSPIVDEVQGIKVVPVLAGYKAGIETST